MFVCFNFPFSIKYPVGVYVVAYYKQNDEV